MACGNPPKADLKGKHYILTLRYHSNTDGDFAAQMAPMGRFSFGWARSKPWIFISFSIGVFWNISLEYSQYIFHCCFNSTPFGVSNCYYNFVFVGISFGLADVEVCERMIESQRLMYQLVCTVFNVHVHLERRKMRSFRSIFNIQMKEQT